MDTLHARSRHRFTRHTGALVVGCALSLSASVATAQAPPPLYPVPQAVPLSPPVQAQPAHRDEDMMIIGLVMTGFGSTGSRPAPRSWRPRRTMAPVASCATSGAR